MDKLKPKATTVFTRLIAKMKACTYMKIQLQHYHDLVLEKLDVQVHTPSGTAKLFRLAHHGTPTVADVVIPEMVFMVMDCLKYGTLVIPVSYKREGEDMETGIEIRHNKVASYNKELQAGHACFANIWLKNISSQGFLLAAIENVSLKLAA